MASAAASLSSPPAMGVKWSKWCVSHMALWYVQLISNREVAGSIPDDYGRTRLSSLSLSPSSSFILLGGYQQPMCARVCGVVCVCVKNRMKNLKMKVGIHWPEKLLQTAVWWIPGYNQWHQPCKL